MKFTGESPTLEQTKKALIERIQQQGPSRPDVVREWLESQLHKRRHIRTAIQAAVEQGRLHYNRDAYLQEGGQP